MSKSGRRPVWTKADWFSLGQPVHIYHKMVRTFKPTGSEEIELDPLEPNVTWEKKEVKHSGIIIGIRRVNEGWIRWNGENNEFKVDRTVEVALVVTHMQRSPWYADIHTLRDCRGFTYGVTFKREGTTICLVCGEGI